MKTILAWTNGLLLGYMLGVNKKSFLQAYKEQREKNNTPEVKS